MTSVAGRDRPRAGLRRRHLGLVVRREPVRRADRREGRRCSSTGPSGCARARRSTTRRPRSAAGPGEQVLRRPGRHGDHPAAGPRRPRGSRRWAPGADTFDSMREHRAPRSAAAGSTSPTGLYDWDAELDQVPELLAEKLKAPSIEAGRYDLVIHPSNLWLTIHESIGHATELDRALGYEANYAGTSFATYDKLNTLQYGSNIMNVTGDRTVEHGLATIGYDDEGVQTQTLGHRPQRRPGRLPARPAHGPHEARAHAGREAAPTAAPSPTPPATSPSSGWPTSRCSRPRTAPAPRS